MSVKAECSRTRSLTCGLILQLLHKLRERHPNAMTELGGDGQRGIRFSALDLADVCPADAAFPREAVFAHARRFAQLLQAARQALADALGVIVGIVVVL